MATVVLDNSMSDIRKISKLQLPIYEQNLVTSTPKQRREAYFLQTDSVEEPMQLHSKLRNMSRYHILEQDKQQLLGAEIGKIVEHLIDGVLSRHETAEDIS